MIQPPPISATDHDHGRQKPVITSPPRCRKRYRKVTVGPITIILTTILIVSFISQSRAALFPSLAPAPLPIPLALASITHPVAVPAPQVGHGSSTNHGHQTNSFQTAASTVSSKVVPPPPMNANDVIGYIVVPYPGGVAPVGNSNARADLQSSIFSMLSPFGSLGLLGRNYRTLRSAYTPPTASMATSASSLSPFVYNPYAAAMSNPLAAYSAAAYQGYPSLYGYNTRFPFMGLFG